MNSKLSLRWRDHHSALITMLENHLDNSTLSDCVIAAEGQYIKAHKVVLSSCSPYFQLLFTLENEKNPIVVLKDVKFDDLKAVIDFVYRGEVQVFEDQLVTFLETAESLQIKGLGRNNNERFGKRKKDSSGKRSREHSNSPSPEENSMKRQAYDAEEEEEALELVPVLEENQRDGWKSTKREPSTSYHNDVPSMSTSTVRPYNFRSSTKPEPSSSQGSAMNIEIAPALPEPSLSAEDCLAETDSVVKTESLSDSEMGQAEEYMDDALSEGGADSFMKNDMEEMVGGPSGGNSHMVDQPLMRSHYSGGPSTQSESTNMAPDNSMMASQMANSQDFMLGLGTLDSAPSGSVSGGHMSADPSTSQGEDAVSQPAPRPIHRRSVLRPVRHPELLLPQLPGSFGRNHLDQPTPRHAIGDSSESFVPLEARASSFGPVHHPIPSSQSASFSVCPSDRPGASNSKDLPVDVSSIKLEDPVLRMVPNAYVTEAEFREHFPQRIMDTFELATGMQSGDTERQEGHVGDRSSGEHRDGSFGNLPVPSDMSPYYGPPPIAPWPPPPPPVPGQSVASFRAGGVLTRKKHVCPLCRKVFLKFNYLKVHMRVHTGEKPFRCNVCPATFTQGNALVYHKRTHTGEKPYRCDRCDDSFATISPLYRHRRRVHGMSPPHPAARGRPR